MKTYTSKNIPLPSSSLFPKLLPALLTQAKFFTGIDIVIDPHWRATPSLNGGGYLKWLKETQKQTNAKCSGFVNYLDKGAYIVFADHGLRWFGQLSSGDPVSDQKAGTICHELGHLLTKVNKTSLSHAEIRFYDEQCAVTAEAMLKQAIGNKNRDFRASPMIREFQPPHMQEMMEYDCFSVYTPCPLARFYESSNGHVKGAERYLSSNGIVRFDLVAEDIASSSLHFRMHLAALEVFGAQAAKLTRDPQYAEVIAKTLKGFEGTKRLYQYSDRDQYAIAIIRHWWNEVSQSIVGQNTFTPKNIYVGEAEEIQSIHHANSYFLNLAASLHYASEVRTRDRLLQTISKTFQRAMSDAKSAPEITSLVKVDFQDKGKNEKPRKQAIRYPRGWFGKIVNG